MLKKVALGLCLFVSFNAMSQLSFKLGGGMANPKNGDSHLGLSADVRLNLGEKLRLGADLGYFVDSESTNALGVKTTVNSSVMPITGNVEYLIMEGDLVPYAGIGLGVYVFGAKIKVGNNSSSNSDGYFGFAPVVGAEYFLSDHLGVNLNAKYHTYFYEVLGENKTGNIFGLNIGLRYKL